MLGQVQRSYTKNKTMSNFHHMSAQTIFSVLDYLSKWKRYMDQMKSAELARIKGGKQLQKDMSYHKRFL